MRATGRRPDELTSALQAALRNAAVTREVLIESAAANALPAVAARCAPHARWLVVADTTTWHAAGATVQALLHGQARSTAEALVFEAQPRLKPTVAHAQHIAEQLRAGDAHPVAVGSGVISDLVKYGAALAGKPYLCLATAASMDGYAAPGAALLQDGFKRTLPCAPPLAVLADPEVLAAAPVRMAAWGYGDLAGKAVAGADWLLADALGIEALNPAPFALVQDNLARWLAQPQRLAGRDRDALAGLLAGLLVSGFAMQAHGNSRPASGSDHQFAHLWEMENLQLDGEPAAHGACVGVGCVAMLALYEWLLAQPQAALSQACADPAPAAEADDVAEIEAAFGRAELVSAAREEMKAKRAAGSRRSRVRRFAQIWPALSLKLTATLSGANDMQQQLRAAGGAAHPADLGLSLAALARDYRRARLIRRRYTLLDLLEDIGWLDRAVDALFAADGFWGRQSRAFPTTPNGDTR
jgi:glycerol-1-phosphate dehydrogenase [NAD(P)+]